MAEGDDGGEPGEHMARPERTAPSGSGGVWPEDRVGRSDRGRSTTAPLTPVDLSFDGVLIEWRGPAPYYFVPVPDAEADELREVAGLATYGWGVIPVEATIGGSCFTTSLIPRDGGYLLPVKSAVRAPLGLEEGDAVAVSLTVHLRGS